MAAYAPLSDSRSSLTAKGYTDIMAPKPPATTPDVDVEPRYTQRTWLERLGRKGLAILLIGDAFIFACVGVLAFLWIESSRAIAGQEPALFWRLIVDRGFMTQTVTIVSAVMRVALGFQVGLVTTMLAALILEQMGTSIPNAPLLSIIRVVAVEPQNLFVAAPLRQLQGVKLLLAPAILLAGIIATLSQFTSTILVSDFQIATVSGVRNISTVPLLYKNGTRSNAGYWGVDFFKSNPSAHWRFAEYKLPPLAGDGFDDTGETYRAFLPFSLANERESLEAYTGPAMAIDARVICFPPRFFDVNVTKPRGENAYIQGYFAFDAAESNPFLIPSSQLVTEGPWYFNTTLQMSTSDTEFSKTRFWKTTLWVNRIGIPDGVLTTPSLRGVIPSIIDPSSYLYMFLNTTAEIREVLGRNDSFTDNFTYTVGGPWSHSFLPSGVELFSGSVCYAGGTSAIPGARNVTMLGKATRPEPRLDWSQSVGFFDTEDIRRQLGALPEGALLSGEDRDILSLEFHGKNDTDMVFVFGAVGPLIVEQFPFRAPSQSLNETRPFNDFQATMIPIDQGTLGILDVAVHPAHTTVFQDILRTTGRPALALQAFMTRFLQMVYYQDLKAQDNMMEATFINSSQVLVPARWNGFIIIMAMLVAHILLVKAAATEFLARTKSTMLGNAWQAVAQVVSEKTLPILHRADGMTDKEVVQWINERPYRSETIGIVRSRLNGRSELGNHRERYGM